MIEVIRSSLWRHDRRGLFFACPARHVTELALIFLRGSLAMLGESFFHRDERDAARRAVSLFAGMIAPVLIPRVYSTRRSAPSAGTSTGSNENENTALDRSNWATSVRTPRLLFDVDELGFSRDVERFGRADEFAWSMFVVARVDRRGSSILVGLE